MPVSLCDCPYCCGGCEIIDEFSIQGYICIECKREHIEIDEETGEIYEKGERK